MENFATSQMSLRGAHESASSDKDAFAKEGDIDLCAWIAGARVQIVKAAPDFGPVTGLWSVYIQPARSLAQQRWTGADVARDLCATGYVRLVMGDKVFEAGTPSKDLPSREDLRDNRARYITAPEMTLPNSAEWLRSVTERRKKAMQPHV